MLPTASRQTESKSWLEENKNDQDLDKPDRSLDEDPKSNQSMDEGGAEGGEDEMTELKADQEMVAD